MMSYGEKKGNREQEAQPHAIRQQRGNPEGGIRPSLAETCGPLLCGRLDNVALSDPPMTSSAARV
jgi:hypothetical protein